MTSVTYQQYQQAKQQYPDKYARDLATLLNITEAQLTHARVGQDAIRLVGDIRALFAELITLGEVKALTRNEYAVHEHLGTYHNQQLEQHTGLILNPGDLDLRLFLDQWQTVFAIQETDKQGAPRHSIQFFDPQGMAIHKIYATEKTDMSAWDALINKFTTQDNPPLAPASPPKAAPAIEVDTQALEQEWRQMTNIHQFFSLLKRHNISRQQAFTCVSDDLAYRVTNSALRQVLSQAQRDANEIMVFVGNSGCVQIFTGTVLKVVPKDNWIHIFNPRFTLHLIEDAISTSWVTRKPTVDGWITSLELFAEDGTQIAQLFGRRREGDPEQTQWRQQLQALSSLNSQGVA